MARLLLLGTGAALSGPDRTTAMLAFDAERSVVVVDCGGDVVQRLLAAGVDLERISLLVLTHAHPDHVSGFPLFMEKIWLAKRRRPIPVVGPRSALDAARKAFAAFNTRGWKGLPEIDWRDAPADEGAQVWADEWLRVTSSPGSHGVPSIALRVESLATGGVVAYSGDTARSDAIARLADGADILVHEATGDFRGHTTPQDAAHVALQAGVGRLVLVHLPPSLSQSDLEEARESFAQLELGEDGASYPF
jgi:ribonuclease Z